MVFTPTKYSLLIDSTTITWDTFQYNKILGNDSTMEN